MSFSAGSSNTAKAKEDVLKAHLLESLEREQKYFNELAEAFFAIKNRTEQHDLQYAQKIIETVDRLLEAGDWDSTLFLRGMIRPFKEMREDTLALIEELAGQSNRHETLQTTLVEGTQVVFISLFSAQGHDLKQWELLLRSIDRYVLGRPIYQEEADVEKLVRLKTSKTSEAYIRVVVQKKNIQSDLFGVKRTDRHGSPLLLLAAHAVQPENIREFVHEGKHYDFRDGKLVDRQQQ